MTSKDAEYRIIGEVGPDEITCKTDWMEIPRGEARGIKLGMEMRGWSNVRIEGSDGFSDGENA